MALTRKLLKTMGIDEEKIDQIIEAHSETVNGLKGEIEELKPYKAEAEKIPELQKKLTELEEAAEKSETKNPWKVKYDALKEEVEEKEKAAKVEATKKAKTEAYKALLKETGIAEKRIDAVTKVAELDKLELDEDGKIKGAEELAKSIRSEWSDFIATSGTQGTSTPTPPANGGKSTMTKEEIRQISDPVARQKAMAENAELFGLKKSKGE